MAFSACTRSLRAPKLGASAAVISAIRNTINRVSR